MSQSSEYNVPLDRAYQEQRRLMALPENIAKKSWMETPTADLQIAAQQHLDRMNQAIADGRSGVARLEAANVANFCWMAVERAAKV